MATEDLISIVRCCLSCRFLDIDPGEGDYSEVTPGAPASVRCRAPSPYEFRGRKWTLSFEETLKLPVLIKAASECGQFTVNPELLPDEVRQAGSGYRRAARGSVL